MAALSQAAGSMQTRCWAPLTGVCALSCSGTPGCGFLLAPEHLVAMHAAMSDKLPISGWQRMLLTLAMLQSSSSPDCNVCPSHCCQGTALSDPPSSRMCHHRAYEMEKGFVRDTPLTYVVALSGSTAKDVTQR